MPRWLLSNCSFEPDLNLVAIRIGNVSIGEAGSKLATAEQAPSGAFGFGDGTVDVTGIHQPKAEVRNATAETGGGWIMGKGDGVVPAGGPGVDESISPSILAQPKDLLTKPKRASQVPDGKIYVGKAVSLNHNYLEGLSRLTLFMSIAIGDQDRQRAAR